MATANVRQARSYLHATTDGIWERSTQGTPLSDDDRVELRLAATSAARRSVEAVDLCYHAAAANRLQILTRSAMRGPCPTPHPTPA